MSIKELVKSNSTIMITIDNLKMFVRKNFISDTKYIHKMYRRKTGKDLQLDPPETFNEKIQWLKLYWRDPLATICADKYLVRNYVEETIGSEYLNELIEVHDSTDSINIDRLPNSFVVKGNNGSGNVLVCKNKEEINWNRAFTDFKRWLNRNYFYGNREWVYKDIEPKIIIEKYLSNNDGASSLTDYKFYCFNGKPHYCQIISNRGENETIDFYDSKWKKMPFNGLRKLPQSKENHVKPNGYEKMLELSEKLSKPFPFVRVDFFYVNDNIIFGELTFFPQSGMGSFYPKEWNEIIGNKLELPN